jgi:WD40 repeat protein
LDGTLRFWTGVERERIVKNLGGVHDFAFAPDGGLVATASGDGIVSVLHSGTALEFWQARIGDNRSVAWSPDGNLIAVGTRSGTLEVLKVENSVLGPPVLTAVVSRMAAPRLFVRIAADRLRFLDDLEMNRVVLAAANDAQRVYDESARSLIEKATRVAKTPVWWLCACAGTEFQSGCQYVNGDKQSTI